LTRKIKGGIPTKAAVAAALLTTVKGNFGPPPKKEPTISHNPLFELKTSPVYNHARENPYINIVNFKGSQEQIVTTYESIFPYSDYKLNPYEKTQLLTDISKFLSDPTQEKYNLLHLFTFQTPIFM
jgi:hypothetical protein